MADFEGGLSIWHAGERILQEKFGVADKMASVGQRVIRPYLLDQHRGSCTERWPISTIPKHRSARVRC